MLIVQVKEGEGVEKALKKLKKKFEKTQTLRELRNRKNYTKPSVRRRDTIKRAKHKQRLIEAEE